MLLSPQCALGWIPEDRTSSITSAPFVTRCVRQAGEEGYQMMSKSATDELRGALEHLTQAKAGLLSQYQADGKAFEQSDLPEEPMRKPNIFFMAEKMSAVIDSIERSTGERQLALRERVKQEILGILPPGDMVELQHVDVFMMESSGSASVYDWTRV